MGQALLLLFASSPLRTSGGLSNVVDAVGVSKSNDIAMQRCFLDNASPEGGFETFPEQKFDCPAQAIAGS